jgi:hypothetical protein
VEADAAVVGGFDVLLVAVRRDGHVEVLLVEGEDGVAERGVGLADGTVVVFDDGEVHPARLREVRGELHPGVPEPHDEARIGELGGVEDVCAGHVVDLAEAGEVGDVDRGPGGDDDVVGIELAAARPDRVVVDEGGGVVDERHVRSLGEVVDGLAAVAGPPERVVVLAFDGAFEVHLGEAADEAVVVAGLEAMCAGREHLFGGHTAPEDTEAAAGLAVVHQREFDARLAGEFVGDHRPGAAVRPDDDYVNHTTGFPGQR